MTASSRAVAATAALLWCVLVVGVTVYALTLPVYTAALTRALDVPRTSGLTGADVLRLSAYVRSFVSDPDPAELPSTWRGQPAFDASAVSHLRDVRATIQASRVATGAAALVLSAFVAWCLVRRGTELLRISMRWGALALAAVIVLALVAGLFDFESLFTFFHGLFFAAGTWTFPYDSLLIRLFPERFWVASGAVWAGLCAAGAAGLETGSRLLRAAAAR